MTIRGFGRGRGSKAKNTGGPSIFSNAPPPLSQSDLSHNLHQLGGVNNDTGRFSDSTTNGSSAPYNNTYQQSNNTYQQSNNTYQQSNNTYQQSNNTYQPSNNTYQQSNNTYQQSNNTYQPSNNTQSTYNNSAQNNSFANNTPQARPTNSYFGSEESEVIMVPESVIGKIIGRAGCRIREIQEESGAKVDVSRDSEGCDKAVTIKGSPEAVSKAKEIIEDIVGGGGYSNNYSNNNKGTIDYDAPIDWGKIAENEVKYRHERWGVLPPVEKMFYIEDPVVKNMDKSTVEEIRRVNQCIQVSHYVREGDKENPDSYPPIPNPVLTFEQAFNPDKYSDILREIYKQGFKDPSPIQKQMWPVVLSGHDCIGIAQTGTGKTLAFLLPAFIHIEAQVTPRSQRVGPTVFCLAPTRELALQIKWEVDKYSYHGISSSCVYGGGDRREQIAQVKRGVDIVVATPGRLNDLLENKILNLDSCSYLILDEADRMLDMGFEPQIKKILMDIRPDRHTIMTSATWPPGVRRIAHEYMNEIIIVNVGSLDLKAASTVTQNVIMTTSEDKMEVLLDVVDTQLDHTKDKCLIFVSRKATADFLSSEFITRYMRPELQHLHVKSDAIHGDRDQCDRESALSGFKEGDITVLIATDVASRGLDVPGITHVINYDFPRDMEDYVHRVGRTGRAGREGTAVTLFTREDWKKAGDLIKILSDSMQVVPPQLEEMAERWAKKKIQLERDGRGGRGGGRGGGGGGRQRYR